MKRASLPVRTLRKLEDLADNVGHLAANRPIREVVGRTLVKRVRRWWKDLRSRVARARGL